MLRIPYCLYLQYKIVMLDVLQGARQPKISKLMHDVNLHQIYGPSILHFNKASAFVCGAMATHLAHPPRRKAMLQYLLKPLLSPSRCLSQCRLLYY